MLLKKKLFQTRMVVKELFFFLITIASLNSCRGQDDNVKSYIMSDKYNVYIGEPVESVKRKISDLSTANISRKGIAYVSVMEPSVDWNGVSANPSIFISFDSLNRLIEFKVVYTLDTDNKKLDLMAFVREKIDKSELDCSAFLASGKDHLQLRKEQVIHDWQIITNEDFPRFSYRVH
jgi:hypothetical protein